MRPCFSTLKPTLVWEIFDEILSVPRPSKHEEQIQEYLRKFAATHLLECREDSKGNIVLVKPATDGFQSRDGIVLQSHMDMVCEKDSGSNHNFMTDPIDAYLEEGWVKSRGTTLGADCGIGMALQLAVLADKTLQHPQIEALFTVDEEQGLTGAMGLSPDILTGKYLINLDSEDEGEIYIGCAGGIDTIATFDTPTEPCPANHTLFEIKIDGLLGGHSGDDINKGRASATKLLGRLLTALCLDKDNENIAQLCSLDGGNLRNAIAREANAVIAVPNNRIELTLQKFDLSYIGVKNEYQPVEPDLNCTITQIKNEEIQIINPNAARNIINALQTQPHGVVAMSNTMPQMVETSTNLASIKQTLSQTIITTSQRSSIETAKQNIALTVKTLFQLTNANTKQSDGYPGWKPNPTAKLTNQCEKVYKEIFSKTPKIKAVHAGLECGLILEKYPQMQAVSIGPTLKGVHSPSEKLDTSTVEQLWKYIIILLKAM